MCRDSWVADWSETADALNILRDKRCAGRRRSNTRSKIGTPDHLSQVLGRLSKNSRGVLADVALCERHRDCVKRESSLERAIRNESRARPRPRSIWETKRKAPVSASKSMRRLRSPTRCRVAISDALHLLARLCHRRSCIWSRLADLRHALPLAHDRELESPGRQTLAWWHRDPPRATFALGFAGSTPEIAWRDSCVERNAQRHFRASAWVLPLSETGEIFLEHARLWPRAASKMGVGAHRPDGTTNSARTRKDHVEMESLGSPRWQRNI